MSRYSDYCERCENGAQTLVNKKVYYNGEDVLTLTHEHYGFYEVQITNGDEKYTSVSNNIFCVDGKTKEITFETSWLACNGYPNIHIEDMLVLCKMPLIKEGIE